MKVEDLMQWFTHELLPSVVRSGKFSENGESQTLDNCKFEDIEKFVSSFASMACFAKLHLKTPSGTTTRDVLVKLQCQESFFREKMRLVPQYQNEVVFYNEVYPDMVDFLKSCGQQEEFISRIVPKCYFASDGDGDLEKAVVILNDLRGSGFRLSDSAVELDLKHCLLSAEKLAQFHSISYAMKFSGWKTFDKLKQSFKEVWFEDIPICREQCEDFQSVASSRGINYLLSQKDSEVPVEYLNKLKQMLQPIFELQKSLHEPTEPLSVIRHGDFNRNNILYRYSGGEVVDARLIDYQRTCYGSPSLDLGFLFYMNMNLEFREKHFDHVFNHYYTTLVKNVSALLKESEDSVAARLPIRAFLEDFEKVAIYHYCVISYFLPIMLAPAETDFEYEMKHQTFKQMSETNYRRGGDVLSKKISETIIDFYRRKFYL